MLREEYCNRYMICEWVVLGQRLHIVFHNEHIEKRWARRGLGDTEDVNRCRVEMEIIYIIGFISDEWKRSEKNASQLTLTLGTSLKRNVI
jgi:hypothetical protein